MTNLTIVKPNDEASWEQVRPEKIKALVEKALDNGFQVAMTEKNNIKSYTIDYLHSAEDEIRQIYDDMEEYVFCHAERELDRFIESQTKEAASRRIRQSAASKLNAEERAELGLE